MIRCPECDGLSRVLLRRDVAGANADQFLRACTRCGGRFSTFEIVAGTAITWETVDDEHWTPLPVIVPAPPMVESAPVPPLRSKHYAASPELR